MATDPLLSPQNPPQDEEEEQGDADASDPLLRQRVVTPSAHHRLLDRDAPFGQSRGRWNIQQESRRALRRRRTSNNAVSRNMKYAWDHWFYALAYKRTTVMMIILFLVYGTLIVIYAGIYLSLSMFGKSTAIDPTSGSTIVTPFCDMKIETFTQSLYFSLSTMTSIGYGISDYFFGQCWTPFILVLLQVFTAICFDAIAVGLLFHRFSRGHKRGKTVLFSSQAVVMTSNRGAPCFAFRVAESRSHTLLSATIRCYCIRHDRNASPQHTEFFVTRPMATLGGEHILMRLPQVVYHELKAPSPLVPSTSWYDAEGQSRPADQIQEFWKDRQVEIVVAVEGADELTGTSIQSRHSYTAEDIKWNHRFVSCVDALATVDFASFHETEPVDANFVIHV